MKNITLINASAGSGKTYTLTQRVVEKLEGDVAPEGLMATTFTNKAAAELRERIRLQLLKHNKIEEAQQVFDGFVGTVNSICARLLKEYSIDAGLSPALDVLPENDGTRLFKIAVSSVINAHAESIESAARRLSYIGGGNEYNKLPEWQDSVRRIIDIARSNQLTGDDLKACADSSWSTLSTVLGPASDSDLTAQLMTAVKDAILALEQIAEPTKGTASGLLELKEYANKISNSDFTWANWAKISKLKVNKDAEGMVDEVHHVAGSVLSHPDFQNDIRTLIAGVFTCAAGGLEEYELFKRKQGLMDFVDQETKVLDLATANDAFRASMCGRLQQLMVDEFQDTSPVQLALFLALNELAGQSTWVGDPKQAIYGFRGTDPQLMDEVTKQITDTETISHSWRSRELLVTFCNSVFTRVFHEMGEKNVRLSIPEERKKTARGGWIESWNLNVTKNPDEAMAIANGINNLLGRDENIRPGDIAVLCRGNKQCEKIAECLEALGIQASAGQGKLLDTPECTLAAAALRYMFDKNDTVALAEIVHLSPRHSEHDSWLSSLVQGKADAIERWRTDPLIAELDKSRELLKNWTPLEALEHVISSVKLTSTVKSWSNSDLRMGNLDTLRGVCVEYLDQCRAQRSAASVAGFILYLKEMEVSQAQSAGEHIVQVLTYHRAKGLEWPVVILASLDSESKSKPFDAAVVEAGSFDPVKPLANRSINFWPWPFGQQKNMDELDTRLADHPMKIRAEVQARKEALRLMYVGMTRARDGMIFAIRKDSKKDILKTKWLDELTDTPGNPIITFPLEAGKQTLQIGDQSIPVTTREYSEDGSENDLQTEKTEKYIAEEAREMSDYLPARITPSTIVPDEAECAAISVTRKAILGDRIPLSGKPKMEDLGNAIHGFLSADQPGLTQERRLAIATGLLQRWEVDNAISPADVLTISDRLKTFIESDYPNATIHHEWPVTLQTENNQLMHGWIDLLIETADGYIIIDHKTYPGTDQTEHAKKFAPQLALYKQAIENATGKKVMATLVHLPISEQVVEVTNNNS